MPCGERLVRSIDQPQVYDLDPWPCDPLRDSFHVSAQPSFQTFELRPVGVQANAKNANLDRLVCEVKRHGERKSRLGHMPNVRASVELSQHVREGQVQTKAELVFCNAKNHTNRICRDL